METSARATRDFAGCFPNAPGADKFSLLEGACPCLPLVLPGPPLLPPKERDYYNPLRVPTQKSLRFKAFLKHQVNFNLLHQKHAGRGNGK